MNRGPSDLEILAENLRVLQQISGYSNAEIARRAGTGVSPGTVGGILNARHMPGIDKVGRIAKVFGLSTYHLLMPDFRPDIIKNGRFDKIYRAYVESDDDGRRVMESFAEYSARRKDSPSNDPNGESPQTRSGT